MGQKAINFILALLTVFVCTGITLNAEANKLDLALARFIPCDSHGRCAPQLADYERFMAEYAFGLSPKILAPAETLGYSGFYMGLEGTLTTIDSSSAGGKERWRDGTAPRNSYPSIMFVPAVHVRKGLPWSFEIGGSFNYLAESELVALGGDIKWSLLEGYRKGFRGALPDVAARGSVMRVLGQSDVDMTIIGVDGSVSYPFGIGGMITLTPYMGYQYLVTIIRIEPLVYAEEDGTIDTERDMAGLSGPNLGRHKLFMGLRFGYERLVITGEFGWGLAKEWDTAHEDTVPSDAEIDESQFETKVGNQFNISFGAGLDF